MACRISWRQPCGFHLGISLDGLLGFSALAASPAPLTSPPAVSSSPAQNPTEPGPTPTTGPTANTEPVPTTVPAGEIAFTGNARDSGYDMDGNGLFEFLRVDIEVDVIEAGWFGVTAALTTPDGRMVALGGLTPDLFRTAPVASTELQAGVQAIAIYFDGRAVRSSEADGPYTVTVGFSDATGSLAGVDLATQHYSHLAVMGDLIEVQNIRDDGVDTDAIPGYNLLRVASDINLLAAGQVTVQGQLFAGSTFLGDVTQTRDLETGGQTVDLDFPGVFIVGSSMDGPFTVYLTFSDAYSSSSRTFDTKAYRHQEFQVPRPVHR